MVGLLAIAITTTGVLVACFADRLGVAKERAELLGGLLFVFGLTLIGVGLAPLLR